MSTSTERIGASPSITRHFEIARYHHQNLIVAFERAVPVIRRRFVRGTPSEQLARGPSLRKQAIV